MKTDKSNSKIFQYREVLHTYGTSLSIDINATVATKHLQKKYLSNIRNTDNIPSSKLDQGLFAAKNVHQSNTGIDRYSLGHDSQSTARDYGRGDLEKRKNVKRGRLQAENTCC